MKRPSIFFWLLLVPALLLSALSVAGAVVILSFFPVGVTWATIGVAVVVVLWFVIVRRRGNILSGSESSLMGRQSSKEGLL